MGAIKLLAGKEVEVVSVSGGWSSIIDHDGKNRKVRNGELTLATTKVATANAAKAVTSNLRRTPDKTQVSATSEIAKKADVVTIAKTSLIEADLSRYEIGLAKTVSGRLTVDVNDNIAVALRGLSIEQAYEIAAQILKTEVADLVGDYKHLNLGMQRMNLGNRCRAAIANREKAKVSKS